MRIIDADALSRVVKLAWDTSDSEDFEKSVFIAIATAPTIEERKKGKWIIDGECIDCSVCRHSKWSRVPFEDLVKRFNFCPNCGADMRDET